MAGSKYTFEAWMAGKFVFAGVTIFNVEKKGLKKVETITTNVVEKRELVKIRKVQKNTFEKLKSDKLKTMKTIFRKRLRNTYDRKQLRINAIFELEAILFGDYDPNIQVYYSNIFKMSLDQQTLQGIAEYYNDFIDNGVKEHFNRMSSPTIHQDSNHASIDWQACTLLDMMEWLKGVGVNTMEEMEKWEKRKSFQIALKFATGELQKMLDQQKMNPRQCAIELGLPKLAPYISDTKNNRNRGNGKNIYSNIFLMKNVIKYCDFFEIPVIEEFRNNYQKALDKRI
jgi:hypothetical protein